MTILALKKSIEHPQYGAVAEYHLIEQYSVDLRAHSCTATVNGYVSAQHKADGKQPLISTTVNIQGRPPVGSDPVQWLYEQMSAAQPVIRDPMGNPIPSVGGNVLSGAMPLTDDVMLPQQPAKAVK